MNTSESIVCKPTSWFVFRAVIMLVMFSGFALMFYLDGSTGYRKKNEEYYVHQAFKQANDAFARLNAEDTLTAEEWQRYAAQQTVGFPLDRDLVPRDLKRPMPWPTILHEYQRMKPMQWYTLWREYGKQHGYSEKPEPEPFDSRKIHEQWVVFWICLSLAVIAGWVLVRTLRRQISADGEALTTPKGLRIPYTDLKSLDLRKWESKGLAFLNYQGLAGKGRIRIDGLTYGGFKKEQGEPAERLMQMIRAHFSGEIIDYAPPAAGNPPTGGDASSAGGENPPAAGGSAPA